MECLRSTRRNARNRRAFISRFFILCAAALLTVSCAHTKAYIEPAASEQTAILQVDVPLWLISVDGKKVSNGIGLRDRKEIRMLPGRHLAEVSYAGFRTGTHRYPSGLERVERIQAYSIGTAKIDFVVHPRCTYALTYKIQDINEDSFRWKASINEFKP